MPGWQCASGLVHRAPHVASNAGYRCTGAAGPYFERNSSTEVTPEVTPSGSVPLMCNMDAHFCWWRARLNGSLCSSNHPSIQTRRGNPLICILMSCRRFLMLQPVAPLVRTAQLELDVPIGLPSPLFQTPRLWQWRQNVNCSGCMARQCRDVDESVETCS